MKLFAALAFLWMAALAPAQCLNSTNLNSNTVALSTGHLYSDTTMTDAAYWLSKPPAVQAMQTFTATYLAQNPAADGVALLQAQINQVLTLAAKGFQMDMYIMGYGYSPTVAMETRKCYGYTWIPAVGQPQLYNGPGMSDASGNVSYNAAAPPPGSIVVSTQLASYPPFAPPPPVVSAPPASVIGQCFPNPGGTGQKCYPGPLANPANYTNGQTIVVNGVTYTVQLVPWMFGQLMFFYSN